MSGKVGDWEVEREPYMGTMQVSRVSGGARLFDSEVQHHSFIAVRINTASRRRGLSDDWVYGEKSIVEVHMSAAQWAECITSLNMGSGVPCTISWTEKGGSITPPSEPEDRTSLFKHEQKEHMQNALKVLHELLKTKLSKAQKASVEKAILEIDANSGFVAAQFEGHMERRVSRAKAEVEAFFTEYVHRAGIEAIQGGKMKLLDEK